MPPRYPLRVPVPPRKSSTRSRDPRKKAKRFYRGKDEEEMPRGPQDWHDSQTEIPTSSIVTASYRMPRLKQMPSLIDCCIRSFAGGFDRLTRDVSFWEIMVEDFEHCPHPMLSKIWERLIVECPQAIPFSLISKYFLNQVEVKLPGRYLPSIQTATRLFTFNFPEPLLLTTLEISNAEKVTDVAVASVLFKLPNLNKIVLRDTPAVAAKTAAHITTYGPQLTFLNLSGTNIELTMLREILFACRELRVLKLARCPKLLRTFRGRQVWTALMNDINGGPIFRPSVHDLMAGRTVSTGLEHMTEEDRANRPMQKLETLKLRAGLAQSFDLSMVYNLLTLCPNLRNLDLSENAHLVRGYHHSNPPRLPHLEKLNLMGLSFHVHTLLEFIKATSTEIEPIPTGEWDMQEPEPAAIAKPKETRSSLKKLRTHFPFDGRHPELMLALNTATEMEELALHFTGEGQKRSVDLVKQYMKQILAGLDEEGNIQKWPCLKSLTLSAFRAFDSSCIDITPEHWQNEDGLARPAVNTSLERLDFGGMIMDRGLQIDDSWVPVISRFKSLRFLDASGTLLTTEGAMRIIDACPDLNTLDLTGCRNINPTRWRRQMFTLHKERRAALEATTDVPDDMMQILLDEMNQPPPVDDDAADDMETDHPSADEAGRNIGSDEEADAADGDDQEGAEDSENDASDADDPAGDSELEVDFEKHYQAYGSDGNGSDEGMPSPPSDIGSDVNDHDRRSTSSRSPELRPRKRTRWDITPEQQAQGTFYFRDQIDGTISQ